MRNVREWIVDDLWEWIKKFFQIILVIILVIIGFVIIFNPVSFLFWALVYPRFAANVLYNDDFDILNGIIVAFNGWMVNALPWYSKKHFIKRSSLRDWSSCVQFKYFTRERHTYECLKEMDNEGIRYTWKHGTYSDRAMIAESGMRLEDDEFKFLLEHGFPKAARTYLENNTPSVLKMKYLLDAVEKEVAEGKDDMLLKIFIPAVIRYGLSPVLLNNILEGDKWVDGIKYAVRKAVECYGQKTLVQRLSDSSLYKGEFTAFCKQNDAICKEAQLRLSPWQYLVFHNTGHQLDRETIVAILKGGDLSWAQMIFENEPNYGMVDENVKALVNNNPDLLKVFVCVKSRRPQA